MTGPVVRLVVQLASELSLYVHIVGRSLIDRWYVEAYDCVQLSFYNVLQAMYTLPYMLINGFGLPSRNESTK